MDAINELEKQGQKYVVINIKDENYLWLRSMIKLAGLRTVPQIFTPNGTHIGGQDNLFRHFYD
jgi:glutaredoxin